MLDGYAQKLDLPECGADSAKSDKVLVIGNGESRKGLKFDSCTIPTIGCNALHRDFVPNHLICCDRRMVEEATSNPNTTTCKIYVRDNWHHYYRKIKKNKNISLLPIIPFKVKNKSDEPYHWGSGPYAVLLACLLGYRTIFAVGFDLYASGQSLNNIYKDTDNYGSSNDRPIDPSYWIYQISKIIDYYRDKEFYFYNHEHWNPPNEWSRSNVKFKNICNFEVDIK